MTNEIIQYESTYIVGEISPSQLARRPVGYIALYRVRDFKVTEAQRGISAAVAAAKGKVRQEVMYGTSVMGKAYAIIQVTVILPKPPKK